MLTLGRALPIAAIVLLLSGCAGGADPGAVASSLAQTLAAQTSETPAIAAATETGAEPTVTANEAAPDPLPAANTGIEFSASLCFDFDSGAISAPDSNCDLWAVEGALVRAINGASISGYVTFSAPSKSDCISATYEPSDLAIQTDLYMCFISSQGTPGFIVARGYLGAAPFTGFVFDYWLYD
jgi:hypothetical protein